VIAWSILSEARRRAGFTQRELAVKAGTSQAAIARIERGRSSPSLDTLERLVQACGFDLRVQLAPRDKQHERLIDELLQLTPEERLRGLEEMSRLAATARRA
jgi:transcriptional regulator with XRE-family HTH domain